MGRIKSQGWPTLPLAYGRLLGSFHDGVTVICELAGQFDRAAWNAATPCPEWRAADLAGHLRCVADDYHEYLDNAPVSRFARLLASGAHPQTLRRKLARQNAAELAALPDTSPAVHVAAFAESARAYADRLAPLWQLPHHRYRDCVVTVGEMAGAACAEWHLHAWDLAKALGKDYRPAAPAVVLAAWRAGMPQAAVPDDQASGHPAIWAAAPSVGDPEAWRAAGRRAAGVVSRYRERRAADADPWPSLLRASGRLPGWRG
jgi:hypothetical protein